MSLFKKDKTNQTGSRRSSSSVSPKISNYYTPSARSNARPNIDQAKRKSPRKLTVNKSARSSIKNIAILALGAFFLYNLLYLRYEPLIVIDKEVTTGRVTVYEPAISDLLRRSILNSNKITLQSGSLEADIISEFPEIEDAVVSSSLVGKRPVVHLRQQALPFTVESKGVSYVIAENGVIAGESKAFSGTEKTILIRDESGVEIEKGSRVLRSDDALFFTTANRILKLKGRAVERVRLTTVPREAYIKIEGLGYELRMYLDEPADTQLGSFFSAEKTLGERGEAPVVYMDLRAGEKVYWQ